MTFGDLFNGMKDLWEFCFYFFGMLAAAKYFFGRRER